jgi:hypothetical protein
MGLPHLRLVSVCLAVFMGSVVAFASPSRVEQGEFVYFKPAVIAGSHRIVVIVPGATKKASDYESLALKIAQDTRIPIWAVVLKTPTRAPFAPHLSGNLSSVISEVRAHGFSVDAGSVFLAGHSLGGIAAQNYAKNNALGGLVMLASYITRSNRSITTSFEFPLPILTVGGELDGQTRITRIAGEVESSREFLAVHGKDFALRLRPVVVVPGANHASFADGVRMKKDLVAEVEYSEAQKRIAEAVSDFVALNTSHFADTATEQRMQNRIAATETMVDGYLQSRKLSQNWCQFAQKYVAADAGNVSVVQTENKNFAAFVMSKPAIENGVVDAQVHFEKIFNPLDTATIPEESNSIYCKMKNAAAIDPVPQPSQFEKAATSCREINEKAYGIVWDMMSETARSRFAHNPERAFLFRDDKHAKSGVTWVRSKFEFEPLAHLNSLVVSVASPVLLTDASAWDRYQNMFYCKLLSPARIAEWVLVDGLRYRDDAPL